LPTCTTTTYAISGEVSFFGLTCGEFSELNFALNIGEEQIELISGCELREVRHEGLPFG
jgi:hypothetical protein